MSVLEVILYSIIGIATLIFIIFMFKPKKKKKEDDEE